jgi:hypothetical protein
VRRRRWWPDGEKRQALALKPERFDSMLDADDDGPLLSEVLQSKGAYVAAPPPVVSDGGDDEAEERKRTNEKRRRVEIARRHIPENWTPECAGAACRE